MYCRSLDIMVRHLNHIVLYKKRYDIYKKKKQWKYLQKYLQKNEIKLRHQHHHSHLINHLYYNCNHLYLKMVIRSRDPWSFQS